MTLEYLWRGDENGPLVGYDAARAAKINEIAEYLNDLIVPGLSCVAFAHAAMNEAESTGRIFGNTISAEISARHTISRNPLPFTI